MEPYTQEGLENANAALDREVAEDSDAAPSTGRDTYPPDYYNYRLRGVIVHTGTAEAGHYYSLINTDSGSAQWYNFNDTQITPFQVDQIAEEAFGGLEEVSGEYEEGMSVSKEKQTNAYLLFYERGTDFDVSNIAQGLTQLDPFTTPVEPTPTSIDILCRVKADNERYWRSKNSFSTEYYLFLLNMWETHKTSPDPEVAFELFKFT
jgi:hypothetical protein